MFVVKLLNSCAACPGSSQKCVALTIDDTCLWSSHLAVAAKKALLHLWRHNLNLAPPFQSCPTLSQRESCLLCAMLCAAAALHKPPPANIIKHAAHFSYLMNKHTHYHLPEFIPCRWRPSLLSCCSETSFVSWMEVFLEMTNCEFVFSSKTSIQNKRYEIPTAIIVNF